MYCLFQQTFVGEEDCVMNSKSVPKANASFGKLYTIVQGHYKIEPKFNIRSQGGVQCYCGS